MTNSAPRKKWILVVEDDKDVQSMFTEALENRGYKVLSCTNAMESTRLLTNQKFDCIILDLRLERGSGDQIISYVRRDPRGFNQGTPILIVSGELNPEVIKRIKDSVSGFFVKPFNIETIVEKIKTLSAQK